MAKLVQVKNPFDPAKGRVVSEYQGTIGDLRAWLDGVEVNITIDDWAVADDNYIVKDNEIICVYPVVGKGGVWSFVATLALVVTAAVIASPAAAAAISTGLGVSAAAGAAIAYGLAAATLFIGGTLINRMTASSIDYGTYDGNYENNPTYTWGQLQTMEGQNNPIAITYGKVLSSGQTLGKYISYSCDKEILNWLLSAGEGEVTFSNIKLNDNPIAYYSDVTYETRSGTNDQSIISNFNDTYFTSVLSYELTGTTWKTNDVQGNATEGIIAKIECPNGLWFANDSGGYSTAWVQIHIQYKLKSESEWVEWINQQISGAKNSAIRKEYRKDNLTAGEYEVRVQVSSRSHSETSSRAAVKTLWSSVSSIVYDDFSYPGMALIGIKGVATSQISGSPSITFIKERAKVWVYDPAEEEYVEKNANNPAWACYDMLHRCHRLKNINTSNYEYVVEGVPQQHILYEQFEEWADWCDTNNLHVNIEVNSTGEMLDVINNKIACIGRGVVLRFGTRYGVKWSHVQTPVQMFGMGNIVKDSFKETFLSKNDRANCVEITFTDAERDYERRTITVFGDSYNTDPVANPSQITYDGITSYEQAYREGKYLMACNERLLRVVSFDADVDSIACTVGDVVIVAHDVPLWSHSGRILSVSNVGGVVTAILPSVDSPLTGHNWILRWLHGETDTIYQERVSITFSNQQIIATFSTPPSVLPLANELFDLAIVGESRGLFTIQSITQSSKFRRHIEALQYDANVYSEQYDIPSIIYTRDDMNAVNVTGLSAGQVAFNKADGTKASKMFVSWSIPNGEYVKREGEWVKTSNQNGALYDVYISTDNVNWDLMVTHTTDLSAEFEVTPFTTYYVKVVTFLGVTQSSGSVIYPVNPGQDIYPPNVTRLNCETIAGGLRRYYWDFEYPDPNDIAGFRMKYGQGTDVTWEKANVVQDGLITEQPFETTTVRQGTHTVMIKAVDNAGNESALPAAVYVNFGDLIEDNVLYRIDHHANRWRDVLGGYAHWKTDGATSYWGTATDPRWMSMINCYIDINGYIRPQEIGAYWEQPQIEFWKTPTTPHWQPQFLAMAVEFSFVTSVGGYWWLKTDYAGATTLWYKINEDDIYKQYSSRVRVHAGDRIFIKFTNQLNDLTLRTCTSIIDVPDREEHFTNVLITTSGTELPIKTPNYYTTAVRFDSLPLYNNEDVYPEIVSRNPCVVRVVKKDGTAIALTGNFTWQGFEREVLI